MKKFIALLQHPETKLCYIQFFRGETKAEIYKQRKHPSHKVEAIFRFDQKNLQRTKQLRASLNHLAKYFK